MQQDDQPLIIEDEPLKVLGLFPKRKITTILFDDQKYKKLFNTLCCTICQQLFNNPVYLKCSHRFCKQCLEKYIRFNDKKSCPNCRGDLNTKRDLKLDYSIGSLINYAYGNRNKFCQNINRLESIESQILQKSSSKIPLPVALIRNKPFNQQQPKSPKKKVKTIQEQSVQLQQSYSKKKKSQKQIQLSVKPQPILEDSSRTQQLRTEQYNYFTSKSDKLPKTDDKISPTNQLQIYNNIQNQKQYLQSMQKSETIEIAIQSIKKKRGRKRKQLIVYPQQSNQIEIQQSKKKTILQSPAKKDHDEINHLRLVDERQTAEKKHKEPYGNELSKDKTEPKAISQPQPIIQLYQKERSTLRQQFGNDYMQRMMAIPIIDFLLQIKLQPHPSCYFTPLLACKSIQLSTKATIHTIYTLLSKLLNTPISNVKLFANQWSPYNNQIYQLPLSKTKSLHDLNLQVWKSAIDVQVFDMKQLLSSLEQSNRNPNQHHNQNQQTVKKKKLFQTIDVDKQTQKANPPKKRGRGRTKKTQDKQNLTDPEKDEPKRIIYYQLVIT